jgi:hypothetical protein
MRKRFLALFVCFVLVCAMLVTAGCTSSQVNTVVTEITAYLPTVTALLQDAITAYAAFGAGSTTASDPVAKGLNTAKTDLAILTSDATQYVAATSSADKTTAWTNIQDAVDVLATNADSTLQLAAVKNSNSNAAGVVVLASLDAAVHVLDGYVSSAQSTATVQAKMARRSVRLRNVARYWNPEEKQKVATAYGSSSFDSLYNRAVALGF